MVKPSVTRSQAVSLATGLFNLSVDTSSDSSVKELDSYYDRNFYIRGTREGIEREFVLKVCNPDDSENRELLDELNAVMVQLDKSGIRCSVPQPTVSEQLLEMREFTATPEGCPVKRAKQESQPKLYNCSVRLFGYIPGETIRNVSCNTDLCFKVGCLAAEVDKVLKVGVSKL